MENKNKEILDLLEETLVNYALKFLEGLDIKNLEPTKEMAKNLVGKIGTRITFRDSLGSKRIDDVILGKK